MDGNFELCKSDNFSSNDQQNNIVITLRNTDESVNIRSNMEWCVVTGRDVNLLANLHLLNDNSDDGRVSKYTVAMI